MWFVVLHAKINDGWNLEIFLYAHRNTMNCVSEHAWYQKENYCYDLKTASMWQILLSLCFYMRRNEY